MTMSLSLFSRIAVIGAALTAVSLAADVTGKWVTQVPGRGGQPREQTITLKAEGEKLTGTVSGRQSDTPIQDGKISGDDISFVVVRNFGGNEIRQTYKGKVVGSEIKFTIQTGERSVEATAKRATT
jgi:hypothetical protein